MTNINDQDELVDPRTPILVGVGQVGERIADVDYRGLSPVDLCAEATLAAIDDIGVGREVIVSLLDTVATTRQFENSSPGAPAPLGTSTKFPRSLAGRIGASPRRAVLEVVGGQSPQHLVSEFSREINAGTSDMVLLAGAEAISTIRHLAKSESKPSFADDPEGEFEDRGFGLKGLVSRSFRSHGVTSPAAQYALLENARRAALGDDRDAYAASMGALFAPFTAIAAANPLSAAPQERTAEQLMTVTDRNRMIADPYPRFIVARDQVNHAAAIVMTSVQTATRLGIPRANWVFLHGQADLVERPLLDRNELGSAPSAVKAVEHALEVAGICVSDVDFFDFYSCFPIAVANITDALGLSADDPRGLTLTGGLPFFGGAGNNYSMHAIVEAVDRVRKQPGSRALITANGGVLSKTSVGIYCTTPRAFHADDSDRVQQQLDSTPAPEKVQRACGWATIEAFTVVHERAGEVGVVVGRLLADGARFLARVADADVELLELLRNGAQPIGHRMFVTPFGYGNRATISERRAGEIYPPHTPVLRDDYQFVELKRRGHTLEVTINRPEFRNALHPPAHEELDEIFDAFHADPDLWIAILTGAGSKAFSSGNDLLYTTSGNPMYVPLNGFAGITSRRNMNKPIIAAVNGFAMGGGFEIALACHLVVADENATFALSEVKVGLIAGAGGAVRLPRAIPPKIATELILTGRRITAAEGARLGVVNRVAPPGGALSMARQLADDILAGSPTSVHATLQLMTETAGIVDTIEAVTAQSDVFDDVLLSRDAAEGLAAFAQKRTPAWKNR